MTRSEYAKVVDARNHKIQSSTLRFANHDVASLNLLGDEDVKSTSKRVMAMQKTGMVGNQSFSSLSQEAKKERIRFLWYRVKIISAANLMIYVIRKSVNLA